MLLVSGCAVMPEATTQHAYTIAHDRYAPVVLVDNYAARHNKIGTVQAKRLDSGNIDLTVNPDSATSYVMQDSFQSAQGQQLRNFYYRIHFERVPYRLWPFNITAGRNGGLFIIITVNSNDAVVLVTTVHTCGCYLAFVPTTALDDSALPAGWNTRAQSVFGETLPGRLRLEPSEEARVGIYLRADTHRVRDVRALSVEQLNTLTIHPLAETPINTLTRIPLDHGNNVSFYNESGLKQGYVKYAFKPFELLLMSWWALDPFIGQDKLLAHPDNTDNVFYTSIKPWNRRASSLWPFADFLEFWGWRI